MQVAVFLGFILLSFVGGYKFGLDWIPNFFVLIIASIDNGALLAERALSLSEEPIPWPKWVPFKEHLNHLFKNQRTALPYIGLWISLPMKAIFAICATLLIGHSWLLLVAGLYFLDLALESFFSKSFLKLPIIWFFRVLMAKLHLVTVSKASFWTVVVSVDLFMEAAFSLDESFLAGSRLHNAYAAMYAMLLSTVAMRAINGPFQKLIEFRPIIGKAIYVSILFIGIEFLFSSQKIDIYTITIVKLEWIKPFSSLLIMAIVVCGAEIVSIAKLVFNHFRRDNDG